MILKRYDSYEKTDNGWLIHGDCADVMLVFLSDDVIRVRVSFDRSFPEASYALVTTAWEDQLDGLFAGERRRVQARSTDCMECRDCLFFMTKTLTLKVNQSPFYLTLYDHDSARTAFYEDLKERAFERDHLGRVSHYSHMDRAADHFYGFGEKTGHLDKKGRRLRMSPKDAIGHDPEFGDPMYKHIPFYLRYNENTGHAIGLFYNNSHDCVFDLGQEISGYWERYCYYQAEGGDIDLFLLNGPSPKEVVQRYTWLTGRTILPTKQSLGYCASTMYYAELEQDCDQEIYKVIDKHDKEGIPIDNFWLASGYSSGEDDGLRYTFTWNRKRFPDPEAFFANMNDRGINVICNLKPGVLKNHPYAKYYEERGAFIRTADGSDDYRGRWWGGEGRFIDFTGEAGRNAWKELLKETILSKGMKTVWNDNCEMDGIEDREARCDFEGAGGTMADLKIIHSNMMAWVGVKALAEQYPGERPYVINRAGYAGIQRYAQVWGGDNLTDWRTVKFNIATILGMGLSGCANMGCDIGGFHGPAPEGELLLRWIQSGIFQPRFTINSANDDNTVTQPWMYEEHLSAVRAAYALRYRLFPYLYSLMYEASVTGLPAMRPLFLEFPKDTACYTDKNLTFMFGPSLLVANVVEKGAQSRTVYLPAGTVWFDMNDHMKAYQGGQIVQVPVTLDTIPMFLRGNGILCTTPDMKRILSSAMRQMDLLIGAEADSSFVLYDDDGHTEDYKKGVYAKTTIAVDAGIRHILHKEDGARKTVTFRREGSYPNTIQRLTLTMVSREKGAYWVTADGEKLTRYLVRDNWEAADEGWYYELSDRTIRVKCPMPEKPEFDIVVSREKFDLIGMTEEE